MRKVSGALSPAHSMNLYTLASLTVPPVLIERWSYLPPEHVVLRMDTRRLGEILVKVLYEGGPPFHADFHTRVTGGRM
jgi:hypothetical protein